MLYVYYKLSWLFYGNPTDMSLSCVKMKAEDIKFS